MAKEWLQSWWDRPAGLRDVLAIALPLVVSTSSWTIMHFVDRMFLMWHSSDEMAATMSAGMLHWSMISFPLGLVGYTNTFVAQYFGAQQEDRIGAALAQSLRLALWTAPLFLLAIPLAPLIFAAFGHDPGLASLETVYFQLLTFGAGAHLLSSSMSSFFTGRGETRVVMLVTMGMAGMNIGLDWLLIFGWPALGIPEMGIQGAALATVISLWSAVLVYWVLVHTPENCREYNLVGARWPIDFPLLDRLFRYGGPNGLTYFIEGGSFTLFLLLMGQLGKQAMAATTLAFNVNTIAFIPLIGVGIAVTTLVGQRLGENKPDLAQQATWSGLAVATAYSAVFGVAYVLLPDLFFLGHAAGVSPEEFGPIRDLAVVLLRFVAAYCILDAFNIVFTAALKGAGDTVFVVAGNGLVSLFWFAIGAVVLNYGGGLEACWGVITAWIASLGLLFCGRFLAGHWREMRVIEEEYVKTPPIAKPPVAEPAPTAGLAVSEPTPALVADSDVAP